MRYQLVLACLIGWQTLNAQLTPIGPNGAVQQSSQPGVWRKTTPCDRSLGYPRMTMEQAYANYQAAVATDSRNAICWSLIAARKGHVERQVEVGTWWRYGLNGFAVNREYAGGWFARAAAQGDARAKTYLDEMIAKGEYRATQGTAQPKKESSASLIAKGQAPETMTPGLWLLALLASPVVRQADDMAQKELDQARYKSLCVMEYSEDMPAKKFEECGELALKLGRYVSAEYMFKDAARKYPPNSPSAAHALAMSAKSREALATAKRRSASSNAGPSALDLEIERMAEVHDRQLERDRREERQRQEAKEKDQ